MKILLAVKSCHRDAQLKFNQTIRDTWGKDVKNADLRFFMGQAPPQYSSSQGNISSQSSSCLDEIHLPCGDAYLDLPAKTWEILRWALKRGYDFIFLCDTDTYVVPERMLSSEFYSADYLGHFGGKIGVKDGQQLEMIGEPGDFVLTWAWASGGCGYWLSSRAAGIVIKDTPKHWAEDCSIGKALGPSIANMEIVAKDDYRYGFNTDGSEMKTEFTSHYCTAGKNRSFDPNWMYQRYNYNSPGLRK